LRCPKDRRLAKRTNADVDAEGKKQQKGDLVAKGLLLLGCSDWCSATGEKRAMKWGSEELGGVRVYYC
jgi:hypothetical protein